MSRSQVGEKLHFHVGIKTHFDVDIYIYYHKLALIEFGTAIGNSVNVPLAVYDDDQIQKAVQLFENQNKSCLEAIKHLQEAHKLFQKVIEVSTHPIFNVGNYLWHEYACYNKARIEFILHHFIRNQYSWEDTMLEALELREKWMNLNSNIPYIIKHSLESEYFLSVIEMHLYLHIPVSEDIMNLYNDWKKDSLAYADVLNVDKKLDLLYRKLNKSN